MPDEGTKGVDDFHTVMCNALFATRKGITKLDTVTWNTQAVRVLARE